MAQHFAPYPGVVLTPNEIAFINHRFKLRQHCLRVSVCIPMLESGGVTNVYRPESENPAGGQDDSMWQINSENSPDPLKFLPLAVKYNPVLVSKAVCKYIDNDETRWGPWNYGPNAYGPKMNPPRPARTDDTMRLYTGELVYPIADEACKNLVNPYWKLSAAGIDPSPLVPPPPEEYRPPVPMTVMSRGYSGPEVAELRRFLQAFSVWPGGGTADEWYGPDEETAVVTFKGLLSVWGLGPVSAGGEWDRVTIEMCAGAFDLVHNYLPG